MRSVRSTGSRTQANAEPVQRVTASSRLAPRATASILHVDLDAFYASVELRDRPELRGYPVIVGGANRGVVLSATYEARAIGVKSAMPMTRARRLCPQAVVLPPRFSEYARVSAGVMEILREMTPVVEPLSIDEAFLDVSGSWRRLGSPVAIATTIRDRIFDEQGVTASVGVAPTKFVAKLASVQAKPDGLLEVTTDQVVPFLHRLPVGALWGVGERTEEQLHRLGITKVSQLAHLPLETLVRAFGPSLGQHLLNLSWGRDERKVVAVEPERSIGHQHTFGSDIDDPDVIRRELLRLATGIGRRTRAAGLHGRTVTLTVRFADFSTITRSRTLGDPTDVTQEIYAAGAGLYDALRLQRARLRLVGLRLSRLVDPQLTPHQLAFDDPLHGWSDIDRAADRAGRRFGTHVVSPAALLPRSRAH